MHEVLNRETNSGEKNSFATSPGTMLSKLSKIDFFPKPDEKARLRTLSGGTCRLLTVSGLMFSFLFS